jgi:mono/diheme cytochrome c family protein
MRLARAAAPRLIAAVGAIVLVSLVTLVGRANAGDKRWTAPPEAAGRANPLAGHLDVVGGGRKVFRDRCASCHGDDGRGTRKAPDLTGRDVQGQSDGALFWKIGQGNTRRGMPTFSYLPEPQRWQLVLYLRSLSGDSSR